MGHTAPLTAWPIQPPVLWTLRAGSGKRRGQGEAAAAPGGQQSGAWQGPAGVNPGVHPGPCLEAPSLGRLWEAPLLEGLLVPCRASAGHPRVSAEREGQGPRPQLEGLSTLPPQSRQSRVGAEGLLLPGPVGAGWAWEGGRCVFASVGSHSVPAVCSCTGSPPNPSGTVEQAPGGWPGRVPPARLLPAPLRVSFRTPGPPLSSTPERRLGDTPRSGNRAQPRSPLRVPLLSRRPQGARPPRAGFSDPCCSQSHRGELPGGQLAPRGRQLH